MNFAFRSSVVAALIGLSLIFFTPFSIWDSLNIVGPMLVLVGIAREFSLLINKLPKDSPADAESKKHIQEVAAVLVVILGVTMELIVVPHSLFETADLKLRTTELEATNATMWQTNIALKRSLVTLELKIQPRIITPEQETNFIFLTEKIKKIPIAVSLGQEGFDTETFAFQLRQMFSKAGFGTNEGASAWGIKRDPTRIMTGGIGSVPVGYDASLVVPSLEAATNISNLPFTVENTNGFTRPVIDSTNDQQIYCGIFFVLTQIGIKVGVQPYGGWAGTPTYEFFVPLKGQF